MEPEGPLLYSQQTDTELRPQPDSIHTLPFHFRKIHFNIIHSSTPKSSKWTPSFHFTTIPCMHFYSPSNVLYNTHRPSPPSLEQPNNIQPRAHNINLLLTHYRPASFHFRPIGQNRLLSTLFLNTTWLCSYWKTTKYGNKKTTNAHKGIQIIMNENASAQNKREAKWHFLLTL
jgi:hypothetical protein